MLKKDPEVGLDPNYEWISINALMLIGCLKCSGLDSHKAQVFYRVVQPEMIQRVMFSDKDIRISIFFLCNLATILEFMLADLNSPKQERDHTYYESKMDAYERVFDAVIDDFNISMFGEYANSIKQDIFMLHLMSDGWKYFNLKNLNELFNIKYQELMVDSDDPLSEVRLTYDTERAKSPHGQGLRHEGAILLTKE